jgi:DNA invertase Pin-like site-specific DNA recombinase
MTEPIDIYARVSRLRDKDQTSTPGQITACRAELAERDLPVGEIWTDEDKSAWNPDVSRPGWQALMSRLESGAAGGVIVYDLERFARQLADGERLVKAAERGLVVIDSEGSYDLRKPGDKKNFRNSIVAAEYYSDLLRVKTRRGKAQKAREGRVDKRRSFGFESDGVTVREDEAAVIRDHAGRLIAGESQESLIAELNDTYGTGLHGAKWGYTTYRQVMLRPRNVGLIVHNGEVVPGVRLPGEPILDQLTHDRIVALYASRKPGRQRSGRYVLTGVALCGECGAGLSGRPVSGTDRRQYWCKSCHRVFVDSVRLDEWAEDFSIRALRDQTAADARELAIREFNDRRKALLNETASIEQTLIEIGARLGRREITLQRHDAICGPLEKRQEKIKQELAELGPEPEPSLPPGRTIPDVDAAHINWLDYWENGTPDERRYMVIRALNGRRLIVGRALRDGKLAVGNRTRFDPARVRIEAYRE